MDKGIVGDVEIITTEATEEPATISLNDNHRQRRADLLVDIPSLYISRPDIYPDYHGADDELPLPSPPPPHTRTHART